MFVASTRMDDDDDDDRKDSFFVVVVVIWSHVGTFLVMSSFSTILIVFYSVFLVESIHNKIGKYKK